MGYYVTLTKSNFAIPETQEVLNVIREANTKYHFLKRGGSSRGEKWFSWVSEDYDQKITSVQDFFALELGFEVSTMDNTVVLDGYDNKAGQESLFLAIVAPFLPDGAYTEWRGEDGDMWRYEVKNGRLRVLRPVLKWTDPVPYRESVYFYDAANNFQVVEVDIYKDIDVQLPAAIKARTTA